VAPLQPAIFVIDSFSTDRTVEIARANGAEVVQHEFVNHARQLQWALDSLPIESEWVMRLDADEVLTPELCAELARRLPGLPADVSGGIVKVGYVFMGRRIKFGGRVLKLVRILRKGAGRAEQRWMDERLLLSHGRAIQFDHKLFDWNLKDLNFFTEKHNQYATREAIDVLTRRYHFSWTSDTLVASSVEGTGVKRWIKENIYNHLPLWMGPCSYFLFRYVVLLGFLDGREGLIYHLLQGFWYRFLVGAKVVEFDSRLRRLPDQTAQLDELQRLSGHRLAAASSEGS
jgi:glycosyltransferase involved in cell wall biosynthesis